MTIFITSFQNARKNDMPNPVSIARWEPAGFDFPVLLMWAPFREDGTPIYWKSMTPERYKAEYMKAIGSRFYDQIQPWLKQLKATESMTLTCWCSTKNGRTFCHGQLVGQIIESARPDIEVVYVDVPRHWK